MKFPHLVVVVGDEKAIMNAAALNNILNSRNINNKNKNYTLQYAFYNPIDNSIPWP